MPPLNCPSRPLPFTCVSPQDYDDSYCIQYARKHDACIVSNDKYRDYVQKLVGAAKRDAGRWVRAHRISYVPGLCSGVCRPFGVCSAHPYELLRCRYTFVGQEFMPNPDFRFPPPAVAPAAAAAPSVSVDNVAPAPAVAASAPSPPRTASAPPAASVPPPRLPQPVSRAEQPAVDSSQQAPAPPAAPAPVAVQAGGDMWGMPTGGVAVPTPAATAPAAAAPLPPGLDSLGTATGLGAPTFTGLEEVSAAMAALGNAPVATAGMGAGFGPPAATGDDNMMADLMATAGLSPPGPPGGSNVGGVGGGAFTTPVGLGGYFASSFVTPHSTLGGVAPAPPLAGDDLLGDDGNPPMQGGTEAPRTDEYGVEWGLQ